MPAPRLIAIPATLKPAGSSEAEGVVNMLYISRDAPCCLPDGLVAQPPVLTVQPHIPTALQRRPGLCSLLSLAGLSGRLACLGCGNRNVQHGEIYAAGDETHRVG